MLLIHSPNTTEPAVGQVPLSVQGTLLDKTQTLPAQSWSSRMEKTSKQAFRIKCGWCDGRGSTGSFCSWWEGHWTWAELGEASQQDHCQPMWHHFMNQQSKLPFLKTLDNQLLENCHKNMQIYNIYTVTHPRYVQGATCTTLWGTLLPEEKWLKLRPKG